MLDPAGQKNPHQFVQYRFSGIEHSIIVKPHGSAKKNLRPYKCTCSSTLTDLKESILLREQCLMLNERGVVFLMLHVLVICHKILFRLLAYSRKGEF